MTTGALLESSVFHVGFVSDVLACICGSFSNNLSVDYSVIF
jgi:hypothetical protein